MKTIHRLVLKSYLGPMVLTFFIVMFVLMMNIVWRYIDELVGKGLSAGIIIELMTYFMANMIPMGLPLSMLLAAIMTMGNLGENYELLANLEALHELQMPVLVGVSRKSMIYKLVGGTPSEALNGTTAINTIALMKGASILRVHDVKECVEVVKIHSQMITD